jgi:hypothetical protein
MSVLTTLVTFEEITTGCCGFRFAVPSEVKKAWIETRNGWHCPSCGEGRVFTGMSDAEKLQKKLDAEVRARQYYQTREASEAAARKRAERRVMAYKGHLTRTKKRVGNGTCPCCHRHFKTLEAHMKTKHPEFATADVAPGA